MIKIHNTQTGEIVEREMNEEELAQLEIENAKSEEIKTELAAKQLAKEAAQAKLSALGFTTEDLKALGL